MVKKSNKTYIQINKEVAQRLNKFKLVQRESYNDVVDRLLKTQEKTKER